MSLLYIHTTRNHHSVAASLQDSTELFRNTVHSARYDTVLIDLVDITDDELDIIMIREQDMAELRKQLGNKDNLDVINFSLGLGLETMIRVQQECLKGILTTHREER